MGIAADPDETRTFNQMWNLEADSHDVVFRSIGYPTEITILHDLIDTNFVAYEHLPNRVTKIEKEMMDKILVGLFYQDLLPKTSALIYKEKMSRDFAPMTTVSRYSRMLGLILLVLYILSATIFIYYFALEKNEMVEELWFWSCFTWWLIDVLILRPTCVLITDVFLPTLLASHLYQV